MVDDSNSNEPEHNLERRVQGKGIKMYQREISGDFYRIIDVDIILCKIFSH